MIEDVLWRAVSAIESGNINFDMAEWGWLMNNYEYTSPHICNTPRCLAGQIIANERPEAFLSGNWLVEEVARLAGLTEDEAYNLFTPGILKNNEHPFSFYDKETSIIYTNLPLFMKRFIAWTRAARGEPIFYQEDTIDPTITQQLNKILNQPPSGVREEVV